MAPADEGYSVRLLRDSRGKPSWTLTLALPISLLITARFLAGGVTLPGVFSVSVLSGAEYALAVGVWLGLLAQREFVEKRNGRIRPEEAPK